MNHKLLTKFVFSGMQKNKKTLIPYLLAGTMTVMIYYILQSLAIVHTFIKMEWKRFMVHSLSRFYWKSAVRL